MRADQKLKTSPMSNFPDDINADILSRLPVKDLVRFRCVSNPWRKLISSPDFAKLHLKRATERSAEIDSHTVLMSTSSKFTCMSCDPQSQSYHFNELKLDFQIKGQKKSSKVFFTYQKKKKNIRILGSCNGLIFLRIGFKHIIMWNPSTRYFKVLPKPRSFRKCFDFGGFGFDASIDDYKVVIGTYELACDDGPRKVEVFTWNAKSNIWRKVQDIGYPDVKYEAGTFANGALHWLKQDGAIMSFDLAQEQFGEFVALPDSLACKSIDVDYMEIGVLQGCLCLYVPDKDKKDDEVWVMKGYGVESSWSKLFSIPYESVFSVTNYIRPLCSLKSGEVLMDVDGSQLEAYSTKDHTFKTIRDCHRWYEMVVYVESLVSLY